ncbi:MAG: DUF2846 domain-containing protein [Acidobacteriia bacterium]|nr:DUF2846 domain-containing protein [Terriglobia bacterium]
MKLLLTSLLTFCFLACLGSGYTASALTSQSTTPQTESAPATTQPAPQGNKAIVYFYRYKQYAGSALAPSVYCDEAQIARMENGRYFAVRLDPGKHTFRSNDKQSGAEVDLKPGQEYFLRVEIASGFMKGHGRLVAVVPEQAKFELKAKNLKPLDADKVTDKERVSLEPITFTEAEKTCK